MSNVENPVRVENATVDNAARVLCGYLKGKGVVGIEPYPYTKESILAEDMVFNSNYFYAEVDVYGVCSIHGTELALQEMNKAMQGEVTTYAQ